jgi:hypothetical protein
LHWAAVTLKGLGEFQNKKILDILILARKELLYPLNWGAQVSLKISSNQ